MQLPQEPDEPDEAKRRVPQERKTTQEEQQKQQEWCATIAVSVEAYIRQTVGCWQGTW